MKCGNVLRVDVSAQADRMSQQLLHTRVGKREPAAVLRLLLVLRKVRGCILINMTDYQNKFIFASISIELSVFLQGGIKSSVLKTVVFYGNENAFFSMFSTSMT